MSEESPKNENGETALPRLKPEPHVMTMTRHLGYVTLELKEQETLKRVTVLTLHAVEAAKFGERLLRVARSADGEHALVEGIFVGGPPSAEQMLE